MDDDRRDLIDQLATRAGMLMEDAGTRAITLGSLPDEAIAEVLASLAASVGQMAAIIEAARALTE